MARPAKAVVPKEQATVVVNIDDFVRTRDSVVTGLATLQSAVQDLSHAYIAHTNTVLGRAPIPNVLAFGNPLENGLLVQPAPTILAKVDAEEPKKKRKRAPHDPNAPKRALTPYFLYMQTARSKIAAELGASAKPKDVADEGTRRWATMPESEKKIWHVQYSQNLAQYRERMAAYKAGKLDGEAAQQLLADTTGAAGLEVILGAVEEEEEEEEDEEEEPTPEPPKAPTPPRSTQAKRRKTEAKAAPAPAKEPAPPVVSKKEAEKVKSPEKKKKSKKEKEADAEKTKKAAAEAAKAEATPSKEKKGRKKRKSDAISADA